MLFQISTASARFEAADALLEQATGDWDLDPRLHVLPEVGERLGALWAVSDAEFQRK